MRREGVTCGQHKKTEQLVIGRRYKNPPNIEALCDIRLKGVAEPLAARRGQRRSQDVNCQGCGWRGGAKLRLTLPPFVLPEYGNPHPAFTKRDCPQRIRSTSWMLCSDPSGAAPGETCRTFPASHAHDDFPSPGATSICCECEVYNSRGWWGGPQCQRRNSSVNTFPNMISKSFRPSESIYLRRLYS